MSKHVRINEVALPGADPLAKWMNGKWALIVGRRIVGWFAEKGDAERFATLERASVVEPVAMPDDTGPFADWLAREMPPGTVISAPRWWASRILQQIAHLATRPAAAPQPKEAAPARGGAALEEHHYRAAWEAARALTHIAGMARVGKDWKEMADAAAHGVYAAFGDSIDADWHTPTPWLTGRPSPEGVADADEMIALARKIRGEFAKLHALMADILATPTPQEQDSREGHEPMVDWWLKACDWPVDKGFTWQDMPDEHDPCYVYMPCGGGLAFHHHAKNGVDQARAQFVAAACNAYLSSPHPAAHVEVVARVSGLLRRVLEDNHACGHTTPDTLNAIDAALAPQEQDSREGDHAARVAELEREVERLRAVIPDVPKRQRECKTLDDWRQLALYYESMWGACSHHCAKIQTRAEAAERSLAEAERDAARYRWLRDECLWTLTSGTDGTRLSAYMAGVRLSAIGPDDDEFDTAIDAAMAREGEVGNG